MKRYLLSPLVAAALALASSATFAQDVLIRNAKVHTAASAGTLNGHDVLVRKGTIAAIGRGLMADNIPVVDANGRPLTPALFGGVTGIGIEEITLEPATNDGHLAFGQSAKEIHVHPEFDVTRAYNPASILIPNIRNEGIGFTLLGADSRPGGSIIGGQGGIVRLDGSPDPLGGRVLFITLGALASPLSGDSRAGHWLILDQLIDDQIEYQVNNRMNFMRFLDITISDDVPDSKTVWNFREKLIDLGIIDDLFSVFTENLGCVFKCMMAVFNK